MTEALVSTNSFPPLEGSSGMHLHLSTKPKTTNNNSSNNQNVNNKCFHHFNDKVSENLKRQNINIISNKYEAITGVTPTQIYMVDNSTLYINLVTPREIIHNISTANKLRELGLSLKLSSNQMDKNSVFCSNAPKELANMEHNDIIKNLSDLNKELVILDAYVSPIKNNKNAAIKITVLTQTMISDILNNGIKVLNTRIDESLITRAKILNTIQCTKCFNYGHNYDRCKNQNHTCPHCTQNHILKNCPNKKSPAICCNCKNEHRAT